MSDLAAEEWGAAHRRVRELVAAAVEDGGEQAAEVTVPACPDWTVRQLLAHMVGLGADVLDGDEPDDHNAAWTQAQVDARDAHGPATLLAEWDALADRMVGYVRETDVRPLNDLVIHEQDLRGALGTPGARDTEALRMVIDTMLGRVQDAARSSGLAPLRLETVGTVERGPEAWFADDEPGLVLEAADPCDALRALTSRRSEAELRELVTAGELDPYLDALTGLGPLPAVPLPGERPGDQPGEQPGASS